MEKIQEKINVKFQNFINKYNNTHPFFRDIKTVNKKVMIL